MHWQWKAFAVTFATIFLAELGDKTQIATINFAAKGFPLASVVAGAASALLLAVFLGVFLGSAFARFVNPEVLSKVAGALFVAMGVLILLKKI